MIRWPLLVLLLLCDIAYADTGKLFAMSCATDLSAQFLGNIFGSELLESICTIPASKSPLGSIFSVFNAGLLIIAGGFISYSAVSGALGKASDGGQAGGGKSNPWAPVRLATGTTLLIPMKSGYSLIQLIVIWAVMHGVGLANAIWYKQIDILKSPPTIEAQKSVQSSYNRIFGTAQNLSLNRDSQLKVTDIFSVGTCLAVLEKANLAFRAYDSSIPIVRYTVYNDCKDANGESLGSDYFCAGGDIANQNACGIFKYYKLDTSKPEELKKQPLLDELNLGIKKDIILAKERAAILLNMPIESSRKIDEIEKCDSVYSVCAAMRAIYLDLNNKIEPLIFVTKPEDSTDDNAWAIAAKQQGWITAGQHYYKFSAQTKDNQQEYDFKKANQFLPSIHAAFEFPGYDGDKRVNKSEITNDDANKMFSINTEKDLLQYLLQRITIASDGRVKNSILNAKEVTKTNVGITDSPSAGAPVNQTMQGALMLKNNMFNALVLPIKDLGQMYDDSVFQATSNTILTSVNLTTPLLNLFNMTSAAAASLTGLNIRKNSYIDNVSFRSIMGATFFNYEKYFMGIVSSCGNLDRFEPNCILNNAGIIGYLKSYYEDSSNSAEEITTASRTIDPISNLSTIGRQLIKIAVDYWVDTLSSIYATTKVLATEYTNYKLQLALYSGLASAIPLVGGVFSAALGVLTSVIDILYKLDTFNMGLFLPIGLSIAAVIFVLGVMLGLYLPFLPFMIFIFTGIGWVIAVIEAMIAAPLVALGVTHPQGHDLLGKAEQSIILLLGIFVRPSAIILGFITAIFLLKEAMVFVNTGFLTLLTNTFNNDLFGVSGNAIIINNVIIVGVLVIYVYIIMAIINQVFSLIYQVPEKLLRWIGSAPENTGISQIAGEVKQGVQSGGQTMAQGGQQMGGQKPEIQTADTKDLEKASRKLGKKGRKKIEGKFKSGGKGGSGAKTSGGKGGK